jgi:alpha-tubulin suppressor-like RCC1 family protein
MSARTALFRTRVVAGVVLLGGTMALGLACGTSSHAPVGATAISAGENLTCALLSNHKVECWGQKNFGNGDLANSPTPVPVSALTNATQVSASTDHSCALLSNHKVKCWGANFYGELGNGKKTDSSTPVPVSAVANATQVSAGYIHTCALLSNHKVECWGNNGFGQLGDGTYGDSATPVQVKGVGDTGTLSNAAQISAGDMYTCALLSNHSVKCWGENNDGELGNGKKTDSSTPVPVSAITNAIQVSAGSLHTCALLSNHRVKCWGKNFAGELGDDINSHGHEDGEGVDFSPTPVPVRAVTNAIQVSVGLYHTCVLLTDHRVECWGNNSDGELGNGKRTDSSTSVPISAITNAVQISAGYDHNCALFSNRRVTCWGLNHDGELGNGETAYGSLPVRVVGLR